jgi:ribonuclease E
MPTAVAPAEANASDDIQEEATAAVSARRSDPELVAVSMTPEQQELYGWLGLNPSLLLETPPESDNIMVRVVRPGEDADAVLEEARQQLAASAGRRRRRGRGGRGTGRNGSGNGVANSLVSADASVAAADEVESEAPLMVEITPLPLTPVDTVTAASETAAAVKTVAEMKGANDSVADSSRSAGDEQAAAAQDPPEEIEEPRRRRRRSSAASSS